MQPGVTVALATVWLAGAVGVLSATLYPSYPSLDQYSPQKTPKHHEVTQGPQGHANWKLQHPSEDLLSPKIDQTSNIHLPIQMTNLKPHRGIFLRYGSPDRSYGIGLGQVDSNLSFEDGIGVETQSEDPKEVQKKMLDTKESARQRDLFIAQQKKAAFEREDSDDYDSFQDQGPGSIEVYRLDLFEEDSLFGRNPLKKKEEAIKAGNKLEEENNKSNKKEESKGGRNKNEESKLGNRENEHKSNESNQENKLKENQSKQVIPFLFDLTTKFKTEKKVLSPEPNFSNQLEEDPENEFFGVGGVPELQVGCEGVEASFRDKRSSSVDNSDDMQDGKLAFHPGNIVDVQLVYESDEDEDPQGVFYEERDELIKLKKMEKELQNPPPHRGDIPIHLHEEYDEKEKVPVRGDLASAFLNGEWDEMVQRKESSASKGETYLLNGRKLLSISLSPILKRRKRDSGGSEGDMWGYGENEGIMSDDELQTDEKRREEDRRREEARRKAEHMRISQEEERRRNSHREGNNHHHQGTEDKSRREERTRIMEEYNRRLKERENERIKQEEERRRMRHDEKRRVQEEYKRMTDHRRNWPVRPEEDRIKEEERKQEYERRRQEDERRRQEDERRKQEDERRRPDEPRRSEGDRRPDEPRRSEGDRRPEELRRPGDDRRRVQDDRSSEEDRRRQEEERRRHLERIRQEERRRREEERRRREEERRRHEEERRRHEEQRVKEEAERQRNQNENLTPNLMRPAHRRPDRRQEQENEKKLRDYIQRNTPIVVGSRRPAEDSRRSAIEDRRINAPENLTRSRHFYDSRHHGRDREPVWLEQKRAMESRRPYNISGFRNPESRRSHGPSPPNDMGWKNGMDEVRRRPDVKRMEEEARRLDREKLMKEEEERRRADRRRIEQEERRLEEEDRRRKSQRYEEERMWHEKVRQQAERMRQEWMHEANRRSQADRKPVWNRGYQPPRPNDKGYQYPPPDLNNKGHQPPPGLNNKGYQPPPDLNNKGYQPLPDLNNKGYQPPPDLNNKGYQPRPDLNNKGYQPPPDLNNKGYQPPPDLNNKGYQPRPDLNNKGYQPPSDLNNKGYQPPRGNPEFERDRQRLEQERRRIEAERQARNRGQDDRYQEQKRRQDTVESLQEYRRRQKEESLKALPVSATIIVRPGGSGTNSSSPLVFSRGGFGSEIDFPGISPNHRGIQAARFPAPATRRPPIKGPGPCIWAVIQCCPATHRTVSCFESLGCPGVNWDPNPCNPTIIQAAKNEVAKFYAALNQ